MNNLIDDSNSMDSSVLDNQLGQSAWTISLDNQFRQSKLNSAIRMVRTHRKSSETEQ